MTTRKRTTSMLLHEVLEERYFPNAFTAIRDEKTRRHYRRAVRWLGEAVGAAARPEHLNDDGIRKVMMYLERTRGQKPPTINKTRSCLLALARWMREEGLIDKMPRIGKMMEPQNPPQSLSTSQLASLWSAAITSPGSIAKSPASIWWPAVIWIESDTAMRMTELRSLRWEWIDAETAIVRVPFEVRKGKRRGEVYKLSHETMKWLAKLREFTLDSGLVLGTMSLPTYYTHWDTMQVRAGLPIGSRWKTQCLRRTVATLAVIANIDPSRVLRQTTPSIAWQSYVDPTPTATPASAAIGRLLPFSDSYASTAPSGGEAKSDGGWGDRMKSTNAS